MRYRLASSNEWRKVPEKWVARYVNLSILGDRKAATHALVQGMVEEMGVSEPYRFFCGEYIILEVNSVSAKGKRRLRKDLRKYGIWVE